MTWAFTDLSAVLVALYVAASAVSSRFETSRAVGGAVVLGAVALALSGGSAWMVAALAAIAGAGGLWAFDRVNTESRWLVVQAGAVLILAAAGALIRSTSTPTEGTLGGLIVFSGLWITVSWGGSFVARAIKPFTDRMYDAPSSADGLIVERGMPKGFAEGGRAIGRWERLLIFLFVLGDAPTAIGFLVTAKSILRFGEIRDGESQREAEYILIGTLMSFGFALTVSYVTRLVLLNVAPEQMRLLSIGGF